MMIGILECGDVAEELRVRHGDYPEMFARLLGSVDPSLKFEATRVNAGEIPGSPLDADAWLVTGSRHGIYDDLPWIEPLKVFLRNCASARVPVVGICFGHQILAEALGGHAKKSEKGWGLGVQDYRVVERQNWMADLPDNFSVRALHQDQVVSAPPDTTTIATSPHCEYAALVYGDADAPWALTIQAHPEFGAEFMEQLITIRTGTVIPVDVASKARKTLDKQVHSDRWAQIIVDFLAHTQTRSNV